MLVNSDKTDKTRLLGVLVECKICGVQLITNSGFNICLGLDDDYSGRAKKVEVYISCPMCLEYSKFEDYNN